MAKRTPEYSLHKPTGHAYVRIRGEFTTSGSMALRNLTSDTTP